ncbi:cobalamin biosynthesis protein CobD [Desulfuromonas versatilis]|uniref:Cobalamin biosynthesis protein CobD n=1 Tax=Desulfuromonas versatilis TaxID=2802975 RepID=A0ABM8HTF5_9BACT|nr:adenosylcobinamide-phosphate synthase CbiB [Desulfuromonas versatilis]BCR03749.1 cobalamin biosynthesis protein CobD [Desulfuromonas versatilis]
MEWLIPCAFALDLVLGDPRRLTHPVVLIGGLIEGLEVPLVGLLKNRRLAGILLTALTLLVTGLVAIAVLKLAQAVHPWLGWLAALWLAYTTLALRSLHKESREVVTLVEQGDLDEARRSLALIVGRETSHLDEEGILRACIETVAENTSDGVIGPLFYLFIGGPVLALLYKAASTLDSMVGYRDDRYRELGWASARFDDLLNLVPARLTGLLMALAAWPLGLNGAEALRIMLRDARKHSSPNAGYPEAAAAGALEVQLGGPAIYFGARVEKPTLGDADRPITVAGYRAMVRLMYLASLLALGLGVLLQSLLA